MDIDDATLERLGMLELQQYAGDINAIQGSDKGLLESLMSSPVRIELIAQDGICEEELYEVALGIQGEHHDFKVAREEMISSYGQIELAQRHTSPCLLTAIVSGIYVGDPEDLFIFRKKEGGDFLYPSKGPGEKIAKVHFLYPTKGLGEKLAEVHFL